MLHPFEVLRRTDSVFWQDVVNHIEAVRMDGIVEIFPRAFQKILLVFMYRQVMAGTECIGLP